MPDSKPRAYGNSPQSRNGVTCECGHTPNYHEGDEYGFCLACDCNHYRPVIREELMGYGGGGGE